MPRGVHLSPEDSNEPIQAWQRWRKERQLSGVRIRREFMPAVFVPPSAVDEYFQKGHIRCLLRHIYPKSQPCDERAILNKFSRVFCILLSCGYEKLIRHFVRRLSLGDDALPFFSVQTLKEAAQQHFNVPNATEVADKFYNAQWEWCPLMFKPGKLLDVDLEDDWILPITEYTEIGAGRSAKVYKIKIHSDSNRLEPRKTYYALKHYTSDEGKKFYEIESSAYDKVMSGSPRTLQNIVTFHGSFKNGDACDVILEYAEYGTLEDYFRSTTPPLSAAEGVIFWKNFLDLAAGVKKIHLPGDDDAGWHQDIKPANILVCPSASGNPYDCTFKLSDLGSAHFKRPKRTPRTAVDLDSGGTRVYGAPECYQLVEHVDWPNRVSSVVDIWSLGAIFFEGAVWAIRGWRGLMSFRDCRVNATKRSTNMRDHGAFHDGCEPLPEIFSFFEEISHSLRRDDHITHRVVDLIQMYMLCATRRSKADYIVKRLKELFKDPLPEMLQRTAPAHTTRPEPFQSNQPSAPPRVPPQTPPKSPPVPNPPTSPDIPLRVPRTSISNVQLSFDRALQGLREWERHPFWARGKRDRREFFPPLENYAQLDDREMVFLIDDSESMHYYRRHVRDLFQILVKMTKDSDKDGLDLCMSSHKGSSNSKRGTNLLSSLDKAPFKGTPDITTAIHHILEEKLFSKSYPHSRPKPVNIYVLTDGDWGLTEPPEQFIDEIRRVVTEVKRRMLASNHVAIQFIRFGHSSEGQCLLQKLDDGLVEIVGADIIDTTDFEGCCMWKILLGASNKEKDKLNSPISNSTTSPSIGNSRSSFHAPYG